MLQYLTLYLLLYCNILQYNELFIDKLFISFFGWLRIQFLMNLFLWHLSLSNNVIFVNDRGEIRSPFCCNQF